MVYITVNNARKPRLPNYSFLLRDFSIVKIVWDPYLQCLRGVYSVEALERIPVAKDTG